MTYRLFAGALYAGLAAGLVAAVLQFVFVIPLLVEGELFETGMRVHFQDGSVQSPAGSGGLEFDLVRHGLTVGMAIVSYTAFALLMSASMAIAARRGEVITPRRGAVWGLAGFAAIALSPAAG
ncbi:CbtA family protein, partial [Brevirhabdus pacifica]